MKAICGLDCNECGFRGSCKGCGETCGKPFGGTCMIAVCCGEKRCENFGKSFSAPCPLKEELVREFNALGIPDMEEVKFLNALTGSYINMTFPLPNGSTVRFWQDERVYLGNQMKKIGSDRLYGIVADENYLLVCEYGAEGTDPEIVVFKRRK